MTVRIRMKKLGRKHRPFYRICAMEQRTPRDGRVLEELGTYDPMVPETDARARLDGERIKYWLSVGAQPSDRVKVLIKKYGSEGTHLDAAAAGHRPADAKAAGERPPSCRKARRASRPRNSRPRRKRSKRPTTATAAMAAATPGRGNDPMTGHPRCASTS